MTDNEIIKALEFCASKGQFKCDGCPFTLRDERCRNRDVYALDLINRQKAEIQADREIIHNKKAEANRLNSKIRSLKAEVERLHGCIKSEDEVKAIMKSQMTPMVREITAEQIDKAMVLGRIDAITEFAERLKEKKWSARTCFGMRDFVEVIVIDQIAKELKGSPTEDNDVKCKDCEYLMFSDCYGECRKAYKGIVNPNDSCGKGKKRVKGGGTDA